MEIFSLILAAVGIGLTLFDHGSDVGLGLQYYNESTYINTRLDRELPTSPWVH